MADIFLSYASEDRRRVEQFAMALEDVGWSVWWDRVIPPGRTFDEVIEEQLALASCVVVVWTESSTSSEWVRTEAAEARDRGVMIPVLFEDVAIPLAFRRIQAADLADWVAGSANPNFDQLVTEIGRLVAPPDRPERPYDVPVPDAPGNSVPRPRAATEEARDAVGHHEREALASGPTVPRARPFAIDRRWSIIGGIGLALILAFVALALMVNGSGQGDQTAGTTSTSTTSAPVLTSFAQQIQQRGSIRVGIGPDRPITDFEKALATDTVERLFGDLRIEFIVVEAQDRFSAVADGQVDLLIRNTTHTTSRAEAVSFTGNYLLDGTRIASPIVGDDLFALDGAVIGVVADSIDEEAVRQAFLERAVSAEILTFDAIEAVLEAFVTGEIEAFADASTRLLDPGFLATSGVDPSTPTMWIDAGVHPLAAAVRLEEPEFAAEVDAVFMDIMTSGAWLDHYRAAFGEDPPYSIDAMRSVPPLDA